MKSGLYGQLQTFSLADDDEIDAGIPWNETMEPKAPSVRDSGVSLDMEPSGLVAALQSFDSVLRKNQTLLQAYPDFAQDLQTVYQGIERAAQSHLVDEMERSFLHGAYGEVKSTKKSREMSMWLEQNYTPRMLFRVKSSSTRSLDTTDNRAMSFATVEAQHGVDVKRHGGRYIRDSRILEYLNRSNDWDFDIFEFDSMCLGNSLVMLMMQGFIRLDVASHFGIDETVYFHFFQRIQKSYNNVPYHSAVHAADVVQSSMYFLANTSLGQHIDELEALCVIVAAAIHDVDHPGRNNTYEIKSKSPLAILYNDQSVLENHHVSFAYHIMEDPKLDLFKTLSEEDQERARKLLIAMVLGTDMQHHFHLVAELASTAQQNKKEEMAPAFETEEQRTQILVATLHSADISNPCKPNALAVQWTQRMEEEWFAQGDAERAAGLPISPMMDRDNPSTLQSQVGFISFIVQPLYSAVGNLLTGLDPCIKQLESNLAYWKERVASE